MSRGFIKIPRAFEDWPVFCKPALLQVFVWMLFRMAYKPQSISVSVGNGETVVELQAGQCVFGRNHAAEALGIKPSSLRNYVSQLARYGFIEVEPGSHYSVITVKNWTLYSGCHSESGECACRGQTKDKDGTDEGQARDTNEEYKELINISPLTPRKRAEASGLKVKSDATPYGELIELYRKLLPRLPEVKDPSDIVLCRQLKARWREHADLAWWEAYFKSCADSDFLTGKVKDFKANLLWLTGPKNMSKVLAGTYDNITAISGKETKLW